MQLIKSLKNLLVASIMIWGISCEDYRMANMTNDKVYIGNHGINPQNIYKGGEIVYSQMVIKSGVGQSGGNVSLSVDESLLTGFSEYSLLPAQYYSFKSSNLNFDKSDYQMPFEIQFDAEGIEELKRETELNYALPIRLISESTSLPLSETEDTDFSIIVPHVLEPYVSFRDPGLGNNISTVSGPSAAETRFFAFVSTNYHNQQELTYQVEVDEEALESYNAANETNFKILPAEGYRLDEASMKIPHLNNTASLAYYLYKDKVPKGNYVLPVTIKQVSRHGINPVASTMLIQVAIQD